MGTVSLWNISDFDISKLKEVDTFRNVTMMRAAPSCDLVALCDINSGLSLYSLRSMNLVRPLYPGTKHISCIAFSG